MKRQSPVCLALLVFALAAVFAPTPAGTWASASTRAPARVARSAAVFCVVPDVSNLPLGVAVSKLRQAHCRLGHVARKRVPGYQGTHVIAQSPAPNTELPRGGAVAVTLAVSTFTGCARGYHPTPYGCRPNY